MAAALLLGYAILVGWPGARLLNRTQWPQRSPGCGIWAWQALSASVLLAALGAAATLALPSLPLTGGLAEVLDACWLAIRQHYAQPGGTPAAVLGAVAATVLVARLGWVAGTQTVSNARRRSWQRRHLLLVAQPKPVLGAVVVPHPTAAIYCLPGRPGTIVCTSAAIATLTTRQLQAALAHERAHLRCRHSLLLLGATSLRAAFPFVPAFTLARDQLTALTEMHADDAAGADRHLMATALVKLAEGSAPDVVLAVGGPTALARVRRLAAPPAPLQWPWRFVVGAATVAALILPGVVAAWPALTAALIDYCPPFPPAGL